ncbi:hypothetical protein C4D60_Mb04t25420 [Musa balbisiana]|uniref:Uncharacterized protein n=1 Tax=Musa balbisiana TaxID=52838 RepID=A0A4S8KEK7_MUSBA|nr:hypothetical protein C4D60_Mb04t25420 [Musa balbisiana]
MGKLFFTARNMLGLRHLMHYTSPEKTTMIWSMASLIHETIAPARSLIYVATRGMVADECKLLSSLEISSAIKISIDDCPSEGMFSGTRNLRSSLAEAVCSTAGKSMAVPPSSMLTTLDIMGLRVGDGLVHARATFKICNASSLEYSEPRTGSTSSSRKKVMRMSNLVHLVWHRPSQKNYSDMSYQYISITKRLIGDAYGKEGCMWMVNSEMVEKNWGLMAVQQKRYKEIAQVSDLLADCNPVYYMTKYSRKTKTVR